MTPQKLYPVGIQTFEKLIKGNYLYIDKTEYVYKMANSAAIYIFLSRPRRFGKSLLTSTLHSYFEGKEELFKGLAIEKLEKEWTEYPVLHFDMSLGKHLDKDGLHDFLMYILKNNEERIGVEGYGGDTNVRLTNLIKRAYEKTGQRVVVLIDEYDAPLLDVVHENEALPVLRNVMRNFYSPLKGCDPYLRFVFLTGITKFSQLSIFSELNNIQNISMLPEYAAICGITEEEIRGQMDSDLDIMAERLETDKAGALAMLKENYDGYHFTWPSPDIYNPFSLFNAFNEGRLSSYWFGSGTPTYLIEMLRKYNIIPSKIGGERVKSFRFDAPTERMTDITPLLYQSGYVTIKGYNRVSGLYTLDIPSKEVRLGLMESLLPEYVKDMNGATTMIADMAEQIYYDDMDGALRLMQKVMASLPYCDNTRYEGHYQQMLYLMFTLLGEYALVEVHTPRGRVDMVMQTRTRLYIIELKIDKSAEAAMEQIDIKDYAEGFSLCKLPVVKVGINFDTERHTLSDWTISEE